MVAVTVDLARYRAVVHYTDCSYYKTTHTHHRLQVPPSVKWKLCNFCKPKRGDIVTIAYDIKWLEKNADAMSYRFISLDDDTENLVEKLNHDGGRTLRKSMQHKYE